MSLLTVVKDVCATVGVQVPTSVFSGLGSNRTMQEMVSLANEMAQRIAYDTRDWIMLRTTVSFSASAGSMVGDAMFFPLPADYKRLLLTTNVRRKSSPNTPMKFIADHDEWVQRRLNGDTEGRGEWKLGGIAPPGIIVAPAIVDPDLIVVPYLHKNCILITGGGAGDSFMNDTDTFAIGERLLKLGMVWQWKAQKGSPYAEDMGSYSDALANAMGHDQPAPILIDRRPISHHERVAYPWPLPT